jgi:deoxyribodipyrimidine photo-lyase
MHGSHCYIYSKNDPLKKLTIFWFRRDLRLNDNAGLFHTLSTHQRVLPLFIFDTDILDKLDDKHDRRVEFIHQSLRNLYEQLTALGSTLLVLNGKPHDIFKELISTHAIEAVYTNGDYEPYAIRRDLEVKALLNENSISFHSYKDQVIFEKNEVVKSDGTPYSVFTPYSKKWKAMLNSDDIRTYPTGKYFRNFITGISNVFPSLEEIGFHAAGITFSRPQAGNLLLNDYAKKRDVPALDATSRMSVHLRFGTISIRELVTKAREQSETFLNELIWREFFMMILWHFPGVVNSAFKPAYDNIRWRNNEEEFERWCNGETGYPLVDAGMRELMQTGYMHNRVRMITASFLCKHLLIDWRWGEAWFAAKLKDYELASNNGNWQWVAGSGCDAAPYFRIFNPSEQLKKFDPDLIYVRKWVPEHGTINYPQPIVDHRFARERALKTYKTALAVK